MRAAGFEILHREGVVVPLPFLFRSSAFLRAVMRIHAWLVRVRSTSIRQLYRC
jgi:hypothetical protein